MSALPEYLTVGELAELLRASVETVRCNASRAPHRLPPATRFAGRVLFRRAAVLEWLERLEAGGAKPDPAAPARRRGRPRKTAAAGARP